MPAAAAAKSLQSCPTLCDPIDGSPQGSPVPGILQARTLEWVAISFSNVWKWEGKVKSLSRVWLLATPWTAAHQAPLSMGFSRQEDWSGVSLPSPIYWATQIEISLPDSLFLKEKNILLVFSYQTHLEFLFVLSVCGQKWLSFPNFIFSLYLLACRKTITLSSILFSH